MWGGGCSLITLTPYHSHLKEGSATDCPRGGIRFDLRQDPSSAEGTSIPEVDSACPGLRAHFGRNRDVLASVTDPIAPKPGGWKQ